MGHVGGSREQAGTNPDPVWLYGSAPETAAGFAPTGPSHSPERTFIITTATATDLFSHPYTYPQHDKTEHRQVSRENLFSEPGEASQPAADTARPKPPRSPFDSEKPA
jgi:hypothetical protein